MTETQRRIKAYQEALPGLKERVLAVALLLVMSLSMLVSASFAWVTISNAPELTGATTTVAANGNLEIALAGRYEETTDEEGKLIRTLLEPAASAVGDSSAAQGQNVFASNLTWGNLVNLSDPDYGLDQIVLRPASLNTAKLVTNPFRSAVYGDDGRVESGNFDEFSYCIFRPGTETEAAHFAVTEDEFGVRAVSTVTSKYSSDLGMSPEDQAKIDLYEKNLSDASSINFTDVNNIYQNQLIKGQNTSTGNSYMADLCTIIGKFMTAKICKGDGEKWENPNMANYMGTMVDMFTIFRDAMSKELEAMAALANVQQYVYLNGNTSFEPYTAATLRSATVTELTAKGIHLAEFESFIKDLNQVEYDLELLLQMQTEATKTGTVNLKTKFPNADDPGALSLYDIVFHLVDVDSCMVHNTSAASTTVGSITNIDSATPYLSGETSVEIMNGILPRFEKRTGSYVYLENAEVEVTAVMSSMGGFAYSKTIEADVYTQYRNKVCLFSDDMDWTAEAFDNSDLKKGEKIETAGDTYGLAIDLWLRTNARNSETDATSYLVLEGKLIREPKPGTDANGAEVGELFYYETTDETTMSTTRTYVYRDANGSYFLEGTNDSAGDLGGKTLTMVYKDQPIGYEGENRLWEEWQQSQLSPSLKENNTTQGGGSCFTFYANSTVDQQAILNLLSHMYVVFTDDVGTYLARAKFDTEEGHFYELGGKTTVPLVVNETETAFTDDNGDTVKAIMAMTQNRATRLTALLYLDGTALTNKEALAASDMQGTLNLQFGNNVQLQTIGDKDLQEAERVVTATVKTANTNNTLDFFTDNLNAEVTVTVTGEQPTVIKAFFQREINQYQGTREGTMVFEGGKANYTFTAPGTYVLRYVQLDGQEYELESPVRVVVSGFDFGNVSLMVNGSLVTEAKRTIITGENSVQVGLSMQMSTDDPAKLPKDVQLVFIRNDASTVSVKMLREGTTWSGNATLSSSGVYTMAHALMDGKEYDLGADQRILDLIMGMSAVVSVQDGTPQSVPLEKREDGTITTWTLGLRVKIRDSANHFLEGQSNVILYYRGIGGNFMEGKMKWNPDTKYYEGHFLADTADTYRFAYLKVGENVVNKVVTAPTFSVTLSAPVSYDGCTNDGQTIYAGPGGDTPKLALKFTNAEGSVLMATFRNQIGKEETVIVDGGALVNVPLPASDSDAAQTWELIKLQMSNVQDDWGERYTLVRNENDEVDVAKSAWLELSTLKADGTYPMMKTVNTILAEMSDSQGTTTFNGTFMQTHTKAAGELNIDLYYGDHETLPVTITKVVLTYEHQRNTSYANGGYEMPGGASEEPKTITLESTDNKHFVQKEAVTFQHAGEYTLTKVVVSLGMQEVQILPAQVSGRVTIVVKSTVPTVTITDASPKATTDKAYVKHTTSGFLGRNVTITYTTYAAGFTSDTANVCYLASKSNWGVATVCKLTQPTVSITLSGYGSASGATLKFPDGAHIYSENAGTTKTTFTWTGDGVCKRWIGLYDSNTGNDSRTIAGTMTATKLELTCNNATYEFTVPNITINNPY